MTTLRVLLVDDDSSLTQALAEYLRSTLKVIVYVALSVPAAISEIEKNGPFDILISDYQMPPHTFEDLEKHLRESGIKTPVIIHSGLSNLNLAKLQSPAVLGVVAKPGNREIVKLITDRFPHAKK